MRKIWILSVILLMLIYSGCDFMSPYYSLEYQFDMSGSGNTRSFNRSMQSSAFHLSSFEKYEIEVVYVYIALFDTNNGLVYDMHTLYNTTIGNGTRIDLVKENLSDKLPLTITHPTGNGIDKIYVGLGTTVTAKGYINDNGTVYRTRSNGTLTADGAREDAEEGIFAVDGYQIPAFSVDESNPPVEPNVKGIYLWLASGGKKHAGHKDLTFTGTANKIDLKFPLEMGLIKMNNSWQTGNMDWVTPYINGTSLYEKYYLKKTGAVYYTDVLRILSDTDGNAVVGQLVCGSLTGGSYSVFQSMSSMWYNADDVVGLPDAQIDAAYAEWFRQLNSTTIYFKAGDGSVVANAFQRTDHSGTITVNGSDITYDCIKVE